MKVRGIELSAEAEDSVRKWMQLHGAERRVFSRHGLKCWLDLWEYDRPGLPQFENQDDVSWEMASRLLQRERKAGNIRQVVRGIWEWVKS